MHARIIALVLVFASLGYGIWHYHSDAGRLRQEMDQMKALHELDMKALAEENQRALANQQEQHQKELRALVAENEKSLAETRQNQQARIASALKEFENIFAGNRQTLQYLDTLEARVKAGQAVSRAEVEKLAVITSGISYLQKQYQKPLQEFTALQDYFDEVAKRPNEKPTTRFGFFKRAFSKNFREAEKEYLREEGARRAFEEARIKFDAVYGSAQRAMKAVNLDADATLKKLDELLRQQQEQVNASDLTGLFDQARKALRTHQNVLDFEPEAPAPTIQP